MQLPGRGDPARHLLRSDALRDSIWPPPAGQAQLAHSAGPARNCAGRFRGNAGRFRPALAGWKLVSSSAHCLVTWMLFAPVVSVNPAVWLVNDPLSEPNVRAV